MIGTLAGVAMISCTDEIYVPSTNDWSSQGYGISFRCTGMVETFFGSHNPASRASEGKSDEELDIKTLHVFFFNKNTGELLKTNGIHNFDPYQVIDARKGENTNFIPIPYGDGIGDIFINQPDSIRIVAIANIDATDDESDEANRFCVPVYNNEGELQGYSNGKIQKEGRTPGDEPYVIDNYSKLKEWVYYPRIRMAEDGIHGDISELPETGMPMIGELTYDLSPESKPADLPEVPLTALMAKVKVSIELDPDQFTSEYPVLTITEYGVRNMPIAVPFMQPSGNLKSGQSALTSKDVQNGYVPEHDCKYGGEHQAECFYPEYFKRWDVTNVPMYHRKSENEIPSDPTHFICEDKDHEFTTTFSARIKKGDAAVTFYYYTFENINTPDYLAKRANGSYAFDDNLQPIYPTGQNGQTIIKDEDKQRWKSTFAYSDRASALILKGRYTTHQGISYNAEFTIYMGADPDLDFQVKRNHQYDNNIVIHGLDYIRNSSDNVYNFDGRVNVYDTENPLYLAIVNERKVDAHATALPMDIWMMLRENGTYDIPSENVDHYTEVKVSIENPVDDDWIRMVYIPREEMEEKIDGHIFQAGRGAEKYFYSALFNDIDNNPQTVLRGGGESNAYIGHHWQVTNKANNEKVETVTIDGHDYPVGAQCGTSITAFSTPGKDGGDINNSRSRVYFYIDENVNDPDRSMSIRVDYRAFTVEDGKEVDIRSFTRYVDIEQRGLLPVNGQWSNGSETSNIPETYMEYYEEYLEHNDPLDRHEQPGEYYTGLQWGFNGQTLLFNGAWFINPEGGRNYQIYTKNGAYSMTQYMVNTRNDTDYLDAIYLFNDRAPSTIFHYCYGKNKRNYDGSAAVSGNVGWYTPGIRELEKAFVDYYGTFPEFRGNWYWSASAAHENDIFIIGGVSGSTYSRATCIILNGTTPTFALSETSGTPGYHSRLTFNRVRTFYRKN